MAANSFLDPTKLEQVQQKYITTFNKVDTLETNLTALSETVNNLDKNYLLLSGGTVTGTVLSNYEGEIANNAFVTKSQVTAMIPSVTGYMPTTGGQFTGDVTTTNTVFTNTSFVTKNYVDTTFIDKAIFDAQTLPIGASIKDVLYRITAESPDSGTIAFEVKSEYESADEFISFFTNLGFTYQKINVGSGTMADACIPPENAEYTIAVGNQNYTIDYIVYYDGTIKLYTDSDTPGSEEKEFVVNIPAGNYNISYNGTNITYHYYLGNTNNQTTTELVIPNMDNYVTTAQYNELLTAYNDLADRLNTFLLNTGNVSNVPDIEDVTDSTFVTSMDTVKIHISQSAANAATIDWGDGSATITTDDTINDKVEYTHTYATSGSHTFTIHNNTDSYSNVVVFLADEWYSEPYPTYERVDQVSTCGEYASAQIANFRINTSFNSYNQYWLAASPLEALTIGNDFTNDNAPFSGQWDSEEINESPNLTYLSIGTGLTDLIFFGYYYTSFPALEEIHFKASTPYTIDSDDVETISGKFNALVTAQGNNLKVYVPAASLDTYKTTAVYSILADYMVGE